MRNQCPAHYSVLSAMSNEYDDLVDYGLGAYMYMPLADTYQTTKSMTMKWRVFNLSYGLQPDLVPRTV